MLEEFNDKQKEVEDVCNPLITKLYRGAMPGGLPDMGGMGGGMSGAGGARGAGPTSRLCHSELFRKCIFWNIMF